MSNNDLDLILSILFNIRKWHACGNANSNSRRSLAHQDGHYSPDIADYAGTSAENNFDCQKNSTITLDLAHAWYRKACAACGDLSQDMELLKREY